MMSAPKRWTVIPTLMCPSDSVRAKVNTAHHGGPGPAMTPEGSQGFSGNVVVCAGNDYFNPGGSAGSTSLNGVFFAASQVNIDDIKDGTTNTLFVSEIVLTADTSTENDIRGRYYNSRHGGVLFSSRLPPNSKTPDQMDWTRDNPPNAPAIRTSTNIFLLARSYHPGGVNVALADGSVHTMSDGVDPIVFRNLGSRHGKEVEVVFQ
jgi:prepilin-type processing-associated H-X9-DG protein